MKNSFLFLLTIALNLPIAHADVILPPLISDNLLLQSDHSAVWGKADPGEEVTVTLGDATASTTADQEGKWRVHLKGLKPGVVGVMTVAGRNKLTVQNVAVGDVWVCSGQSNMKMPLKGGYNPSGGVTNFEQEIAAANFPQIRMFTVSEKSNETPLSEVEGKWEVCTPKTAPKWSAVGYFFGRQLHQDLKIPIGLLHTSLGATSAQAWTPSEVLQDDAVLKAAYYDPRQKELANFPALKEKFEKETLPAWQIAADAAAAEGKPIPSKPRGPRGPGELRTPSSLYNGMVAGATQFPVKGGVWYQGESNVKDAPLYCRLLPAMITSWRKAWNQPDLPFHIVQIANYMAPSATPVDSTWANLRDAQRITAEKLPNTGLAVAIDIGEEKCVHPANKQEVGRRLALIAEAKTYGKSIVYSGPWFDSATFEGAQVKLAFKPGTAAGLTTPNGEPIKGFAIAGDDKKFVWAEAKIETPTAPAKAKSQAKTAPTDPVLIVTAPGIEKPVALRYAWADNPTVNLINEAGLPAVPFRTDDWPQANLVPAATPAPNPNLTATPTAFQ